MHICFLTHNLNTTDGGGRFSHDLVENLNKNGIGITVVTAENSKLLLNFFKIRKIFKDSDIIHAVDIWPNGFYAKLISLGLKKTIIITALGTYSVAPLYFWRKMFAKWACKKSKITAISEYTKSEIKKIMPDCDIEVIMPGFDFDFWSNDPGLIDEEILKLKPYILSVGALKPRKGYIDSIRAFAAVAKKFQNLNYVIVGQGEESDYAKNLTDIIKENGLEERVFFVSSRIDDKKLLGFYRNAELFVLTPIEENHHFEGFGIVYLEAAASGLPIIASLNSGAESAVKDGYNGILVTQNDQKAISSAVLKILENQELKNNFGKNGIEWAKNFDQDEITAQYIKIYYSYVEHH